MFRGLNKYGNSRINGFSSKLEAAVYAQLCLMERGGLIREIKCQQSVYLTEARIQYISDFSVFDVSKNCTVWVEAKGFETDVWKIKLRLWKHYGPGPLQIWKGTAAKPYLFKEVTCS